MRSLIRPASTATKLSIPGSNAEEFTESTLLRLCPGFEDTFVDRRGSDRRSAKGWAFRSMSKGFGRSESPISGN